MPTPHLSPIERPQSLLIRLAYAYSRRQFGKVLTVMKVLYARQPRLMGIAQKIIQTQEKLSLAPELRVLVQLKASQLNGCAFCHDLSLAYAAKKRVGSERFRDLDDYRSSNAFSPREKAALAFVEEATRERQVCEETWQLVRAHFSDVEIVELTWLNAAEHYFNLQAAVLGIESDRLAENLKQTR